MRFFKCLLVYVTIAVVTQGAFAQVKIENPDHVYGFDPLLYNGKKYTYFPNPGTEGTQYIDDEFNTHSSVTLRGVKFNAITLNYDVYNQLLVLKYYDNIGSANLIEISPAWLEAFELGDAGFRFMAIHDSAKTIYQVIGSGKSVVLYYRHKELLVDTRAAVRNRYFSDVTREKYVLSGNRLLKYKNNRGFVKCFSASNKESIKKYLRQHKIKVKKANDAIILELINYCNKLTES